MIRCIKTGCALLFSDGSQFWGDMHKQGRTLIFNSVLNDKGEANCAAILSGGNDLPTWHVKDGITFFERRGVFVFQQEDLSANPQLLDHLRKWGDA